MLFIKFVKCRECAFDVLTNAHKPRIRVSTRAVVGKGVGMSPICVLYKALLLSVLVACAAQAQPVADVQAQGAFSSSVIKSIIQKSEEIERMSEESERMSEKIERLSEVIGRMSKVMRSLEQSANLLKSKGVVSAEKSLEEFKSNGPATLVTPSTMLIKPANKPQAVGSIGDSR